MGEKAKGEFPAEPLYLVLGGFHLMTSDKGVTEKVAEDFKKIGIIKAGPTHCSGEPAEKIFKKYYKQNFVSVKAGQEIEA